MVLNKRKRMKTLNEVKPVKNINNPQRFQGTKPQENEVPNSPEKQDHPHEKLNTFELKTDNLSR